MPGWFSMSLSEQISLCSNMSLLSVFISFILFFVDEWIIVTYNGNGGMKNVGLFQQGDMFETTCNTDVSATQCNYLQTAKASGVLFAFLGLWTAGVYRARVAKHIIMNEKRLASATASGIMQTITGIICAVTFAMYKGSVWTLPDDTNIEYSDEKYNSDFGGAFIVFCMLIFIPFFICTSTSFLLKYGRSIFSSSGTKSRRASDIKKPLLTTDFQF